MTSVNFKCKCPCNICKSEGPIIQWVCPYCSRNKLIDETARIICPGCGARTHYIWNAMFKCGNHEKDYHEISYQRMLMILSIIESIVNPSTGFLEKIKKQCLLHEICFSGGIKYHK